MVIVVAGAGGVVAAVRDRERPVAPPQAAGVADPAVVTRRARDLALAGPLLVTLVVGGQEVARARLEGSRTEVEVGGLQGVQEGRRLDALGASVEVAAADPQRLLAPLVERQVRWEGRRLVLEGTPAARAWVGRDGRLARLEVDLAAGSQLVVTPG